jgi:hypothetical protein
MICFPTQAIESEFNYPNTSHKVPQYTVFHIPHLFHISEGLILYLKLTHLGHGQMKHVDKWVYQDKKKPSTLNLMFHPTYCLAL